MKTIALAFVRKMLSGIQLDQIKIKIKILLRPASWTGYSGQVTIVLVGFMTAFISCNGQDMPANPFVKHMFTADPSAHVWADGRLYVYPSTDIAPPRGADLMDQYHVFSTDDMVNWVDHGEILRASQVEWGRPEGGFMWAPDCAFKDGTYYFYFPHPTGSGDQWNSTWKIGLATSTSPASGFEVQGFIPNIPSHIDPCVFIDDDGQAYFYFGGGGQSMGGKLKDNMVEIDGELQPMQGLEDFHEASWVHKRNGLYYLSYSDNHDNGNKHNRMRYATSENPLGPWTYRGIYMDPTDSYTNHGSIVEYKGQWYFFYHNSALSGHDWLRSICVDKLYYNEDGTIQKVIQTKGHGTPFGGSAWRIPGKIEAEDYDEGGPAISYSDSDSTNNGNQYRLEEFVDIENCGEGGYNVGWLGGGEWLEYSVLVDSSATYTIEFRVATATTNGSSISAEFNGEDKTGKVTIPFTGGWQSYKTITADVELLSGEYYMRLLMGDGAFNINYVNIKLKEEDVVAPPPDPVLGASADKEQLNVYPNPLSDKLIVEYNGFLDDNTSLQLISPSGKVVKKQKVTGRITEIPVSKFSSGMYVLQLIGLTERITRKVAID